MTSRNISGGDFTSGTVVTWSEQLGKRVRTGDWPDQAVSTSRKILEAIEEQRNEIAAQLIDYWMEEAKVVHVVYQVWSEGWMRFLEGRGIPQNEIDRELERLGSLLSFPDGARFDPRERWTQLSASAGLLAHRIRGYQIEPEQAFQEFEALREQWRQLHDRGADFQSGLLTFVANRFGEEALGEAYEEVLGPYLDERYAVFDPRVHPYEETLFRNIYLSFESMRGHLSGPDRTGDLEFAEDDEKVVISFDPCGSGNRGQRGDVIEGTPSRSDPPYSFGVTTERHDWAWNEIGVCYYCAHCCYALEYWPAKQWGHPVRVVDSPLHPDETSGTSPKKCTWTIYKSIEAIPESAYQRIGLTKPPNSAG